MPRIPLSDDHPQTPVTLDKVPLPMAKFLGRALFDATNLPANRVALKGDAKAYFLAQAEKYQENASVKRDVANILDQVRIVVHEDLIVKDVGDNVVERILNVVLPAETQAMDMAENTPTAQLDQATANYIASIGVAVISGCK